MSLGIHYFLFTVSHPKNATLTLRRCKLFTGLDFSCFIRHLSLRNSIRLAVLVKYDGGCRRAV
jgi:hypothetical protein